MTDPYRMMRTDGSAEKSTQPIVHAWCVRVNINATRCTSLLEHVLARTGASGNCACLGAFRHAGANLVSVAYQLVPARLQYGCSTLLDRIDLGMSGGCNTVAVDALGQKTGS